ncbi:MAG: DUF1320 domain-containing protein [Pseudomonadota bacterium]
MAYCSQADVTKAAGGAAKLVELTDIEASGTLNTAVLNDAIAEADAWIDGYLQKRYSVPLASTPEDIRRLAAREVVFLLKDARRATTDDDKSHHEERLLLLRDVAKGIRGLAVEPLPAASSNVAPEVMERDSDESISRQTLDDYW